MSRGSKALVVGAVAIKEIAPPKKDELFFSGELPRRLVLSTPASQAPDSIPEELRKPVVYARNVHAVFQGGKTTLVA